MNFKNSQNNLDYNHPLRPPSEVMKLDRLGSFHQSRLSFTRRLIDDLKYQKSKIEIYQWDIDNSGIGSAIIKIALKKETFSFVIQGHVCCTEGALDAVDRKTNKRNLSIARAKYVYDYLLKKGIKKSRMSYEGMAHKYPLGGSEDKDRRVEILILSD